MRKENRDVYFVACCGAYYLTPHHANRHEKICGYNPANRYKCKGCGFYSEITKTASKGVFYCTKLDDVRFSPYARHYPKHTRGVCADLGINEPIFADNDCHLFEPMPIEPVELDPEFESRMKEFIKDLDVDVNEM